MNTSKKLEFNTFSSYLIFFLLLIDCGITFWEWTENPLLSTLERFSYFCYLLSLPILPYYIYMVQFSEEEEDKIASNIFNFSYSILIWALAFIPKFTDFGPETFLAISISTIVLTLLINFLCLYFTLGLRMALGQITLIGGILSIHLIFYFIFGFYNLCLYRVITNITTFLFVLIFVLSTMIHRIRQYVREIKKNQSSDKILN